MESVNKADNGIEQKRKVVNNAVRICITCGNIGVRIDNHGIYCKNCDSKYRRKEVCVC